MENGCPPSSPTFDERGVKKQTRSGPLTQSQQQLVLEHLRLVESTASNLSQTTKRREELRSHGHEGLVRAAHVFDGSLGVPFAAFAAMHIRWAMLKGLRAERRQLRGHISEETFLIEESRQSRCGTRVDPSFAHPTLDAEGQALEAERQHSLRSAVAGALAQLVPKDRAVVEGHYFADQELKALVRPGASYATIRRRHANALSKLGRRLPRTSNFVGANMS